MRRGFVLVWTVVTAVIAGIAGLIAYQAGYAAGLATKLPAGGAAVAPYWAYGFHPFFGFGFGLFPVLVLILVVVLLFSAFGRRRWGYFGYRGYPGGAGGPGSPSPFEQRMRDWHDRMHDEQPPSPPSATTA
jgi:hypothetical protein